MIYKTIVNNNIIRYNTIYKDHMYDTSVQVMILIKKKIKVAYSDTINVTHVNHNLVNSSHNMHT